jgi:hypothetical protein
MAIARTSAKVVTSATGVSALGGVIDVLVFVHSGCVEKIFKAGTLAFLSGPDEMSCAGMGFRDVTNTTAKRLGSPYSEVEWRRLVNLHQRKNT